MGSRVAAYREIEVVARVQGRHAVRRAARSRAALSERTWPAGTVRRSRAALDRVDRSTARRSASGLTSFRMIRSPPVSIKLLTFYAFTSTAVRVFHDTVTLVS